MNERAKQLLKIVLSLALAIISFLLESNKIISTILYIIAYMIVGYEIVLKALKNIFKGKVFDENFLMTVATMGALCIGEIEEAIAVMILYQLGELFQSYAVDKSRKSISELMDIRPDTANILRDDRIEKVSPDEVNIHELILVKPGEKIPLDGIVVEGESMLDTHALTGESVPKSVRVNDEVSSGCINNDGTLKIKVTKEFGESTVSKILDLVENATNKKAKSENFIAKFSRVYTPIVVVLAVVLAVIPPIFIENSSFSEWIYRALSFLVVSCPCALVISIPLSFFGGIGACSKIGVLIKGSNYLEALANAKIVVCDKTGTLTEGIFEVQKIDAIGYSSDTLLEYATSAECFSNHPISLSLKRSYNRKIDCKVVTNAKEKSGHGVSAVVDGKKVLVGNEKLMEEYNVEFKTREDVGTIIYVAIEGIFAGTILIADRIKDDSYRAIESFRKNGIEKIVMLTGDSSKIGTYVAEELKLDEYHAELLPEDKVAWIEKMMAQKRPNDRLVFIGDGINDAPVLALSDIGVAMGGLGSDAAIEAADIVIMNDEPSKLSNSIHISKKTMRVVRENIVFAIAVKLSVLVLSAFGMATMWASVFADVGVSILAIINALRILKIKR